jgi:glucokinase
MVVGIDIGGTRVKAAVVSGSGETIRTAQAPTEVGLERFEQSISAMLRGLLDGLPAVSAAGIGCKGIIDSLTTEVLTLPGAMHYLEGRRLGDIIRTVLPEGCPVIADNDARIAMAGEKQWGAARNCQNAMLLTLGTGVGGAIIANGQILRGAGAIAGHIGHLTIDPDGPECVCGNRGCLEMYFSALAIERDAAGICRDVFNAARNGDEAALRIVQRATKYLGGAIAGLLFVLDPERVILSGQITEAGDLLFDLLRKDVHERTMPLLRRAVPIVKSELADPSGTLGAAALALTLEAQ